MNAVKFSIVPFAVAKVMQHPRFDPDGPEVEVVLKSSDARSLAEAVAWLEPQLADVTAA